MIRMILTDLDHTEALEAAGEVTLSNDEDGVARWLTDHIFGAR